MALFKSKNPALKAEIFTKAKTLNPAHIESVMTINGTVNKTALLGIIVLAAAMVTWNMYQENLDLGRIQPYILTGSLAAFGVAVIIIYKKTLAPYLAPIYCALQGLAIGGLSALMEERFPGIVIQAILLTFGILFSLLTIYKLGIIKATENFKLVIASATSGIALYYIISVFGSFFGFNLPFIHDNSISGILFSLFVVIIAALNLVVDFDFIEKGAELKAPKYMEWYAAFGLMVTLIWLYLEILRLLGKSKSRD
ncbi:Bax inhibitor-1/YccA family protein [Formosa sediminum]|uniref:Bax inhibitor-1/YccA family protein n=1 Tax=Formosa sediminum TaxID=2594004 RepID=A0A516GST1_9FLAO|nr:Bax inhibitor-1/YccA family protein [Formosa sediminum]QDO94569.1 Bax inhibitor-1/YccA family protein [Formosa sediminum]